jgi:hypothetical protein
MTSFEQTSREAMINDFHSIRIVPDVLFDIRAYAPSMPTTDPRGAYLGTTAAWRTPGISGVYDPRSGEIAVPDASALHDAIPQRWRKALVKARLAYPKDGHVGSKAHMTLYGSKGQKLATVTVTSRYFGEA